MKFTEEKLERAFCELLEQQGFRYQPGGTIVRKPDEVLIEEDLRSFLLTQYASKGITSNEVSSIILQLKSLPASDLYESNKTFLRMLADGFILKREDRNQKDLYIQLINYAGLAKQRRSKDDQLIHVSAQPVAPYSNDPNIYKFVNQLEIIGNEKRIPDGILYINGLPLVVFEFKSAVREEATIHDAFRQLTVRYRRDIPLRSSTLRRVAVCCSNARPRWCAGLSSQASGVSSPKGTAVAPHWRANSESSRSGAFFISIGSGDLAVELSVDWFGQAKSGATVEHFDAVELERIKAQLHRERAQT